MYSRPRVVLREAGVIENWGRGYKRILKAVKEQKLLPPKLESLSGLMVTYYTDPALQLRAEKLNDRDIAVIDFTAKNGRFTTSDVQKLLGISKPTAKRVLQSLLDKWLRLVPAGKYSYYELIAFDILTAQ